MKFNPWHDPANGQFTDASTGRSGAGTFRGGGGRSGGGGASGSWEKPRLPVRKIVSPASQPAPARPAVVAKPPASPATSPSSSVTLKPPSKPIAPPIATEHFQHFFRNGYEYEIDRLGRTRRVFGTLGSNDAAMRSHLAQRQAGGADRRPTDDGGHYVAVRFNGPTDAFNHFAQNANFNRGRYRVLEDNWARAKQEGKQVTVTITPSYEGASLRPSRIKILVLINGHGQIRNFYNEHKGISRGK